MSEILRRVYELSQPAPLPANAWDFLSPSPNVRRIAGHTNDLIVTLTREFSADELRAIGIAVGEGEALQPAAVLAGENVAFLALNEGRRDKPPRDLVTTRGHLAGKHRPLLSAWHDDEFTSEAAADTKMLLVSFDMNDLIVLRALRLPVTVACGLDDLDAQQLTALASAPLKNEYSDAPSKVVVGGRNAVPTGVDVVLVGWGIAAFSPAAPAGLAPVIARLRDALRCGFRMSSIRVWHPSHNDVARIRAAAQLRSRELAAQQVLRSVEASGLDVASYCKAQQDSTPEPNDLAGIRQKVVAELAGIRKREWRSPEIDKLIGQYHAAFQAVIVQPLLTKAQGTADPEDRGLLLALAEIHERLHLCDPLVLAAAAREPALADPARHQPTGDQQQQQHELREQLCRLHRQLQRGSK